MAAQTISNCFVCFKKVEVKVDTERYKVRKRICEQFLVLMSRYLNLNRADDLNHCGSEKTLDFKPGKKKNANQRRKRGKLFSCDHCLPLIESLCAIYKDWSVLKVKLNASIKLMANLMQDVSTSMTVKDDFEEAIDFRIRFIKQALNKLNSKDFPHLALKRLSTDSLPAYGKNFCDVVSEHENVALTATDMTSGTTSKVEPELVQEQEEEVAVYLDDADWQPNSDVDVEMDPLENDDDDDYYNEDEHNETDTPRSKELKTSQKRMKTKSKIVESTDDGNNPFKCQICGKGFAQQEYLQAHEKRHAQPFKCRLCTRRFSLRIDLQAHEKIHKEGTANQFQCGVCSNFFLQRADCGYHIRRVHNGKGDVLRNGVKWQPGSDNTKKNEEKTFKCQFCPWSFRRHVDKLNHEKIHRKKSFKCPHCEMTFKQPAVFTAHVDRHLKPYQCGLCGTRFTQRNNCRKHQSKIHKVIDGVILKISEEPNEKDASRPPLKIETNVDGKGDPNAVSADKSSESLKADGDDNKVEADNVNAESDSGSVDIWQPGSDEEADDDANNRRDSPGKDEKSNPVQAEEEVEDEDDSKKKLRKSSNTEIGRLRSNRKVPLPHSSKEMLLEDDNATFNHATSLKSPDEDSDAGSGDEWQPSDADNNDDDDADGGKIDRDVESNNPKDSSKVNQNIPSDNEGSKILKPKSKLPTPVKRIHSLQKYKCYQCDGKIFLSLPLLREHVQKEHGGVRLFPCKLCDQTFTRHDTLISHNTRRHPKERGSFHCQYCGKTFSMKYYLRNHEKRNCKSHPARLNPPGGLERFVCDICGKDYNARGSLQTHRRRAHSKSNSKPKPKNTTDTFPCQFCGKQYTLTHQQQYHESMLCKLNPANAGRYICEKCGKDFPSKVALNNHMYYHNLEERPGYPCSFCGKTFKVRSRLKTHERSHKEPAIACGYCGEKFIWESSCRSHIKSRHEGQKGRVVNLLKQSLPASLPAPLYDERMSCKLNPANAARVVCEKCGKDFQNKAALSKHMYHHNNKLEKAEGRGFPCSVCGKTFKLNDHRNNHERFHKEPAIACGYCGEKFIWISSCRHHIKSKHKGQNLKGRVINLLKQSSLPLPTSLPVPIVATTETPPPVLATENNTESAN